MAACDIRSDASYSIYLLTCERARLLAPFLSQIVAYTVGTVHTARASLLVHDSPREQCGYTYQYQYQCHVSNDVSLPKVLSTDAYSKHA